MGSLRAGPWLMGCAGALAVGCGLVLAPAPHPPDAGADAAVRDAGPADAGPVDDATSGDAGDGGPAAGPLLEVCGNGVDDDMHGGIDDGCDCDRYVLAGAGGPGTSAADPAGGVQDAVDGLAAAAGAGVVCVGAPLDPLSGAPCEALYAEDVVMRDGVSVRGAFAVADGVWSHPIDPLAGPCVTTLAPADPAGLVFGAEVRNGTLLEGVRVVGATGEDTAAITFLGGGTVQSCEVEGHGMVNSAGVSIEGPAAPVLTGSRVMGAVTSPTGATAVLITDGSPRIVDNLDLDGGAAAVWSAGVMIGESVGVEVSGNARIAGAFADSSFGVVTLAAERLLLADNALIEAGPAAQGAAAVSVVDCPGAAPARVERNGIVAHGTTLPAFPTADNGSAGVYVSGCSATLSGNPFIVGSDAASSWPAVGVLCQREGTDCRIEGNGRIAGLQGAAGPAGGAVWIDQGVHADVVRNRGVEGCAGATGPPRGGCIGVALMDAALRSTVDGNQVIVGSGDRPEGILVQGGGVAVVNNLVEVAAGVGVHLIVPRPAAVVNFHGNTLVHVPASPAGDVILLALEAPASSPSWLAAVVRGSIFACLDAGVDADTAIARVGAGTGVSALDANDFFGCERVFARPGEGVILGLGGLLVALRFPPGNVTDQPRFVDPAGGDYHLRSISPLIDRGLTYGPDRDYDGDLRLRGGYNDIGMDEVR